MKIIFASSQRKKCKEFAKYNRNHALQDLNIKKKMEMKQYFFNLFVIFINVIFVLGFDLEMEMKKKKIFGLFISSMNLIANVWILKNFQINMRLIGPIHPYHNGLWHGLVFGTGFAVLPQIIGTGLTYVFSILFSEV